MTVKVYRLWQDKTWDVHEIDLGECPYVVLDKSWDNVPHEIIETRAVEKAWLQLIDLPPEKKPFQIGRYYGWSVT